MATKSLMRPVLRLVGGLRSKRSAARRAGFEKTPLTGSYPPDVVVEGLMETSNRTLTLVIWPT